MASAFKPVNVGGRWRIMTQGKPGFTPRGLSSSRRYVTKSHWGWFRHYHNIYLYFFVGWRNAHDFYCRVNGIEQRKKKIKTKKKKKKKRS